MQNESSESHSKPTLFLPVPVEQPGKAYKRLVAISSLSDIVGIFERLNQWDSDAIRSNIYMIVHHRYSDLCPQEEQCIKERHKFDYLV